MEDLTYDIQEQLAWMELADTEPSVKPSKSLELTPVKESAIVLKEVGDLWDTQA